MTRLSSRSAASETPVAGAQGLEPGAAGPPAPITMEDAAPLDYSAPQELAPLASSPAPDRPEVSETLVVDAASFKALLAHPAFGAAAKPRWARRVEAFFDTDVGDLLRAGATLRVSSERSRRTARFVVDGEQVEASLAAESPTPGAFAEPERERLADLVGSRPLKRQFEIDARRWTRAGEVEGSAFEATFAEGEIVAGASREKIREVTFALRDGRPASLYRLLAAIAAAHPVGLRSGDAYARALTLRLGGVAPAVRAAPPELSADATLDEAIGVWLASTLTQFFANWPAMRGSAAGDAVHQIRVSMRRLRSLLGILRPLSPSPELESLRAEAKRIADAFGEARDWDVFRDTMRAGPMAGLTGVSGFADLVVIAGRRVTAGRAHAMTALASPEIARFALAMRFFIASRGWRNAVSQNEVSALGRPAAEFAARALDRLDKKVRKRGRGFADLAPEPRHQLRIALKQLRYGCEFFGPLFEAGGQVKPFARAAARLQDALGAANDAEVAQRLVAEIDFADDANLAFAAGAVVGWCGREGRLAPQDLAKSWKDFRRAERFWRDEDDAEAEPAEAEAQG